MAIEQEPADEAIRTKYAEQKRHQSQGKTRRIRNNPYEYAEQKNPQPSSNRIDLEAIRTSTRSNILVFLPSHFLLNGLTNPRTDAYNEA